MAFRMTGRVLGALARERNDVQPALRKVWKAHEHTDGLVRNLSGCTPTSVATLDETYSSRAQDRKCFDADGEIYLFVLLGFRNRLPRYPCRP